MQIATKQNVLDASVKAGLMERVSGAFAKMGIYEPFIAAVMSKIVKDVDPKIPTAATNGKWIKFGPEFTNKQTDAQLFGLALHEALHVVLMHMWRRGDRDPALWNYTNDAIINAYILKRGYELPEGGVILSWVKEDMSSEEVYDRLKKEMPEPPPEQGDGEDDDEDDQGKGGGQGDDGDDEGEGQGGGQGQGQPKGSGSGRYPAGGFDGTGDLIDAEDEADESDMKATILASAKAAKLCGSGSALIDRVLEDLATPTVHWLDVLRNMMTSTTLSDLNYKQWERRFTYQNIYLPSMHDTSLGGCLLGFDVSGSISFEEIRQAGGEIDEIAKECQPEFLEVVYFADRIFRDHIQYFGQGEDVDLKPQGTGGTSFKPVLDYLEEGNHDYACLIMFTDMCADFSRLRDPGVPVLWARMGKYARNIEPPFGLVVDVEIN
jgi:predicted metal-dependent peptidase